MSPPGASDVDSGVYSVYAAFADSATRWPERDILQVLPGTASAYGIDAGSYRFDTTRAQIDLLAEAFSRAGYTTGMRVSLLLENRPIFFITWLALNRIGVSVVPINPDLRLAELEYLIGHAEPALIVAIDARVAELQQAAANAGVDVAVITDAMLPRAGNDNAMQSSVQNSVRSSVPAPRSNAVVADTSTTVAEREAAVLYTSGTTGSPKGCVLSNNYFLLCGQWYAQLGGIAKLTTNGERMITPLPIFHMNAMAYSFMAMVTVGGCLTVLDRFHPSTWWQDVKASNATCLHYLGVMPSMLMGAEPSPTDKDHAIKFGFGAGVDAKLQDGFEQRFGFPLVEAWAMTETGAGAVVAASTDDRLIGQSCLGVFGSQIDYRIVDDNGANVTTGQPGELLVRHNGDDPRFGFFSHYYKDEKATAEAWADGWFHTGDLVRQDAAHNIYFVDRKKNVIRRSGENIAAVEVESILMRHPEINAAAVAAVPDELRGDEVFACLQVNHPGAELAHDICQWCLQQMAYYKVPGYIAFVDSLPLTPTQKIQRAKLKRLAQELLSDANTVDTTSLKKRQQA
jgi:acyl-CoA synthetase (AMP-forming)/AMP-acid ligase II